jgi:hypothetical protein
MTKAKLDMTNRDGCTDFFSGRAMGCFGAKFEVEVQDPPRPMQKALMEVLHLNEMIRPRVGERISVSIRVLPPRKRRQTRPATATKED